jgi:hypothetical protein
VRTFYQPDYETEASRISRNKGACRLFADRYVEEDALNLTLDLILMKGVILHLLYNRGTSPRRIEGGTTIRPDIQAERATGETVRAPQMNLRLRLFTILLAKKVVNSARRNRTCLSRQFHSVESDTFLAWKERGHRIISKF